MTAPVMHPATQHQLERLIVSLPHALMLTGPAGVGIPQIAEWLGHKAGMQVSWVRPQRLEVVDYEKGSVSVEAVRQLYDFTKTKQPSGRLVIIDAADSMGTTAQNAFLKLLEEPNSDTHFVLISNKQGSLLPTIQSRVQHIAVRKITKEQSQQILAEYSGLDATKVAQLLFIAQGLPAELHSLASDSDAFEQRAAIIRDARTYLQGSPYDRLLVAKKYKDARHDSLLLLEDAGRILASSMSKDGSARNIATIDRIETIYERIAANGNVRIQLASGAVL